MMKRLVLSLAFIASSSFSIWADEPSIAPKPVPATRTDIKIALEKLKTRQPRLPLPPPTEEEIEQAKKSAAARGTAGGLGGGLVNNARMRNRYLSEELRGGGFSREPDPVMTLKTPFLTELFWITSRINNCHYCLGHQEVKLSSDGLTDDQIAALDGDWSDQTPARKAAFEFTRKLTYQPHEINDKDINELKKHYTDLQVLEIVFAVSRYNATNRWTDSLGIPQEDHREFLTETSTPFAKAVSRVAPLNKTATAAAAIEAPRPRLESRSDVLARLAECRKRTPRFPLVDDSEARAALPTLPAGPAPNHTRLLVNFPKTGTAAALSQLNLEKFGKIEPLLRAQIAWIAARHDRAWYALGIAQEQLKTLGQSDDAIFALDKLDGELSEGDRLALKFTQKLTVTPQWIVDQDIESLRKHFSDQQVAEIVYRVTQAGQFDRLTESAGLPL